MVLKGMDIGDLVKLEICTTKCNVDIHIFPPKIRIETFQGDTYEVVGYCKKMSDKKITLAAYNIMQVKPINGFIAQNSYSIEKIEDFEILKKAEENKSKPDRSISLLY